MTIRENMTAILEGRQPEYYGDFMHALEFVIDPVYASDQCPQDGLEHPDTWGTVCMFKPGAPGRHPHITDENAVIKDIERWEEQLQVPSLEDLDWSAAEKRAAAIDRKDKFAAIFCAVGLFERTHFLMGMENALINYMEYPDEMAALLRKIADYKIAYIKLAAQHLHPDVIFFHDDWGSKQNVFLPPDLWRELIKPLQKEIADTIHANHMIYIHHADCICEPLAKDMVEIGIDIWQGVIPQNNIVKIQEETQGRLAMIGGVDGPKIDIQDLPEEQIRSEVQRAIDTYCPAGRFYPAIANGRCFIPRNNEIYLDELAKYGREFAQKHPIV